MIKSNNEGNVLIIVLVYFMIVTSAITLTYSNAKAANRANRSNQTAISDRLELVYLAKIIKQHEFIYEPENFSATYHQTDFSITSVPLADLTSWQLTIMVTKIDCEYRVNSIYDGDCNSLESFEFDD